MLDAVVVGSGPNGLSAALRLAQAGCSVLVVEGQDVAGGGMATAESTRPGFLHDTCSAVHPTGALSPYWQTLDLARHGLRWRSSPTSVAHPLTGGRAVLQGRSLDALAESLGRDGPRWRRLFAPWLRGDQGVLWSDLLAPLGLPRRPFAMARFGALGALSAQRLAGLFQTEEARALLAGHAGHSVLPFSTSFTGAFALVFSLSAHTIDWPVAEGGSGAIADALIAALTEAGGAVETGRWVGTLDDLPPSRLVLFDTSPRALATIAGDALPARFRRRLEAFEYGPGVFKVDWALDGPIPWTADGVADASTVHVGGTFEEIAAAEAEPWAGRVAERPFLIVCQQSALDPSRAPDGQHTGYAYCHVPSGCPLDLTDRVEEQIERFAPGFRDRILARASTGPADFEYRNPNLIGGSITGGAATWDQLFTRPVAQLRPYATPNPRLLLCSASTPPGGGVHGMAGFHAAGLALRRLRVAPPRLPAPA